MAALAHEPDWLAADYIYIPLGGSRCNVVRHTLNTLIVFAVSGLWHGADLRYLEWALPAA